MNYVATFHTHFAAMRSQRNLKSLGIAARLAPVPRVLSSSCGTCVIYTADEPHLTALDRDTEQVALQLEDGSYKVIHQNL